MQRETSSPRWFANILATVLATLAVPQFSQADVIYSGTGASADVFALGQLNTQAGSTPASLTDSATVNYTQYPNTPGTATVTASGTAFATPGASTLLQVQNSLSATGSQGPFVGAFSPPPESEAAASWNNVAATVRGPAGSALPGSIQVDFRVTYQNPDTLSSNGAVNGLGWLAFPHSLTVNSSWITLPNAGTPLQPGEQPVQKMSNGLLTGTLHVDLPLSATGTSSLFSIGLGSDLAALGKTLTDFKSLSLTGIFLPDGTPISAGGYSVSFESGLPPPPPAPQVPEPSTLAVWGLLASGGALGVRRRRSS